MTAVIQSAKSAIHRAALEISDDDIAKSAALALRSNPVIPFEQIRVEVRDGLVTLEGSAQWRVQKMFAEAAVKKLRGITSVRNEIEIRPQDFSVKMSMENGAGENGNNLYQETGEGE